MNSTVCVCVCVCGGGQYLCVWDVDGEVEWSRNDDLHALPTFHKHSFYRSSSACPQEPPGSTSGTWHTVLFSGVSLGRVSGCHQNTHWLQHIIGLSRRTYLCSWYILSAQASRPSDVTSLTSHRSSLAHQALGSSPVLAHQALGHMHWNCIIGLVLLL